MEDTPPEIKTVMRLLDENYNKMENYWLEVIRIGPKFDQLLVSAMILLQLKLVMR